MEDITNATHKICQNCQKPVRGRSDKKFCTDMCRNTFNNRINSLDANLVRNVTARLLKNRRILKDQLGRSRSKIVLHGDLLFAGFNMSYLTHRIQTGKDKYRMFCYEYSFESITQDKIKISHSKNQK